MLAFELALNFIPFVGAPKAISNIRYLKYLSKARNLAAASTTDKVLVWSAKEGISNAVEFLAGNALAVNNYIAMTTDDPAQKALSDKLNYFLGAVMVGSLYSHYRYRTKLIRSTEEVDDWLKYMNDNNFSIYKEGMTDTEIGALNDALAKVTQIAGNQNVSVAHMIARLTDWGDEGSNILARYGSFTQKQQYAFAIEYGENRLINGLKEFNASGGSAMDNWKNLFDKNIMDRQTIDLVLSNKRTTAILRYYEESPLRDVLESLTYEKRVKFLDEFGDENIINSIKFNKLKQNPKKLELLVESQSSIKRGHIDFLDTPEILKIIDSDLSDITIDFLRIKNSNSLQQLIKNFLRDINNIDIDINRLANMFNGSAYPFINSLTPKQKKLLQSVNKLIVNVKSYDGNVLVGNVDEIYVAGWKSYVNDIFGENIPSIVKEPTINPNFNIFKQNAIFKANDSRVDDTEIKFIFNFLETHWNNGNKFVIEIESTYFSCQSCQGYFLYLKQLAKDYGKTLDITIKANKKAEDYKSLFDILNSQ